MPENTLSADAGLDLAKTMYRVGQNREAEQLLGTLAQKFEGQSDIIEQIESLIDEPVGLQQRLQARTLNREGIQAYEQEPWRKPPGTSSRPWMWYPTMLPLT